MNRIDSMRKVLALPPAQRRRLATAVAAKRGLHLPSTLPVKTKPD